MQAQLFYLESQEELRKRIYSLLQDYVYQRITIELVPFVGPDSSEGDSGPAGRWYVDALKASMVRSGDFGIVVECLSGGHWYMGYDLGRKSDLKLSDESVTALFPAVSIMGRMVIMPDGVQEVIKNTLEFSSLPKPLDMHGLQLISFQDAESVRAGVERVGAQLKSEVVKLCRRYMQVKSIRKPDFDGLAKVLGVDISYLEQLNDEILAPWVRLTPKIVSGPAAAGARSPVTLEVKNESNEPLGRVRVKVTGPSDTLKEPIFKYLNFSEGAEQTQSIRFYATPATPPFCPFWVDFEPDDPLQTYTPVLNAVMLDVQ